MGVDPLAQPSWGVELQQRWYWWNGRLMVEIQLVGGGLPVVEVGGSFPVDVMGGIQPVVAHKEEVQKNLVHQLWARILQLVSQTSFCQYTRALNMNEKQ